MTTRSSCDVSILIVGYNSRRFLDACLGAIADAAVHHSCEVHFVNNGTDESEAFIAEHYPLIKIAPSKGNVGFAAANNYLAQNAVGKWLLLLNPDTRLHPGSVDQLLDAAAMADDFAIFGSLVVPPDGSTNGFTLLEFPNLGRIWSGVIGRAAKRINFEDLGPLVEVDAVSGACMLVRHADWAALGGMDESYFLYAEELDLCWRYREGGGRIGLVPASRVTHDTGSGETYSPRRMLYQLTGNAHFYRKHFSWFYSRTCLISAWVSAWVRFIMGGLLGLSNPTYREMSNGFRRAALAPWEWMRGYQPGSTDPRT